MHEKKILENRKFIHKIFTKKNYKCSILKCLGVNVGYVPFQNLSFESET